MISLSDDWAFEAFANAELGDPRRTRCLLKLASSMEREPSQSIASLSHLTCEMRGAYRFIPKRDHHRLSVIIRSIVMR